MACVSGNGLWQAGWVWNGPAGHFLVDAEPLMWQWSIMARSKLTVAAGILDALGRGFLIATAGVVAGMMFGTVHLAAMGLGLWTVGVAAASGVGCMISSALVRNAAYDRGGKIAGGAPEAARANKPRVATPAIQAAEDVAPEERWAERSRGQRQRGMGVGRAG